MSYYIVLFPSLDVISGFPLGVHVIVNGIYVIITGRDTSEKPKYKHDWLIRLSLRFTVAVLPIAAAFGTSNLVYVLTISGFTTITCYITPFILQVRSIQVCKKKFAETHIKKDISKGKLKNRSHNFSKSTKSEIYYTSYSFPGFSHPKASLALVFFGICLYGSLLSHFFVSPVKLSCDLQNSNETMLL